jgi:hypothetical protein
MSVMDKSSDNIKAHQHDFDRVLDIRDIFGPGNSEHFGDIFLTFQEGPSFIIGQYVFYMVGVLEQYC